MDSRQIYKIGVSFDSKSRGVKEYQIKRSNKNKSIR